MTLFKPSFVPKEQNNKLTRSSCLVCVCVCPFQLSKHFSEFHEISCEYYIIRVHPNAVLCFPTVKNNNMADAQTLGARVTLVPVYS